MISFNTILAIGYVLIIIISYPYLKGSYFPQFPSFFEKFVMMILACVWVVSVPVTFVMKQNDEIEVTSVDTSYDGFVGREA